jgi:hypothetical protein
MIIPKGVLIVNKLMHIQVWWNWYTSSI